MRGPTIVFKVLHLSNESPTELLKLLGTIGFSKSYFNTVGVDCTYSKGQYLSVEISLSNWEVSPSERFLRVRRMFFQGATIAVLFVKEGGVSTRDMWIQSLNEAQLDLSLIFVVYYRITPNQSLSELTQYRVAEFSVNDVMGLKEVNHELYRRLFYISEFRGLGYGGEAIREYKRGDVIDADDDLYNVIIENSEDIEYLDGASIYTVVNCEVSIDKFPDSMEHLFAYKSKIYVEGMVHESLRTLRFRGCDVHFSDDTFSGCPMTDLTIRESDISFDPTKFRLPSSLVRLEINGNELMDFDPVIFSSCDLLESLSINANGLETVPKFPTLPAVTELDIGGNKFNKLILRDILGSFPKLVTLRIEGIPLMIDLTGCEDREITIWATNTYVKFTGTPLERTRIKFPKV